MKKYLIKILIFSSICGFNVNASEKIVIDNLSEKISEKVVGWIPGDGHTEASIEFRDEKLAKKTVEKSLEKGLILFYFLFTKTAIRITPPLTITKDEIIKGCNIIKDVLEQ